MPNYAIVRELPDVEFDTAIERVTSELKGEGFGVLTEIDVKATLKKKLDVDFQRYTILGACNPPLAHQALSAVDLIGLLLPCNVVVKERDGGGTTVAALNPTEMFKLVEQEDIQPLAIEVEERLVRALDAL